MNVVGHQPNKGTRFTSVGHHDPSQWMKPTVNPRTQDHQAYGIRVLGKTIVGSNDKKKPWHQLPAVPSLGLDYHPLGQSILLLGMFSGELVEK